MRKFISLFILAFILLIKSQTSYGQIVISGYFANPSGADSNYEYLQLVATQNINFAVTPYSVVTTSGATALSKGWIAGGATTYGFNLTSGSVVTGQTFYVGGSAKRIDYTGSTDISSATWIRAINNVSTAGDGLGNSTVTSGLVQTGVFGNTSGGSGTNAYGIAVFADTTSTLDSTSIPVDAIFYGPAIGTAKPTTGGYRMPSNDWYTNDSTFGHVGNTHLFTYPTSGAYVQITGTWNTYSNTWLVSRTSATVTLTTTSALTAIATKITLTSSGPVADTVKTTSATAITLNSALLTGNVTSDGNTPIISRGFCYDTIANPDTTKNKINVSGTTGVFTGTITGLLASKTYYYRAFATNSVGTSYGGDSTFTTLAGVIVPTVTTSSTTLIADSSATAAGNVTFDGGGTITERGVCYGTTANPDITGTHLTATGTTGAFTVPLINLTPSTTYYVRAYATNSAGTSYGADSSFKTKVYIPTYAISQVRNINASGVADSLAVNCKLIGVVHGINFAATGYSFYINDATSGINVYKATTTLTSYPTVTEGDQIRVIGKTQQTSGLIQIVPDSIVKISAGNTLNTPILATTLNDALESRLVTVDSLTYISGWPTTGGTLATVLAKHGTDTTTFILYTGINFGTTAPAYLFSITGLVNQLCTTSPYLTKYRIYPRYVVDRVIHYITPTVLTTTTNTITTNSAICAGNVTSDGGSAILERGICYDTIATPDTTYMVTATGTTGTFTANLTGLLMGKLYHYRAFARNAIGLSFGADSTFTTSATFVIPVVTTGAVSNIGTFSATVAGTIANNGGSPVTVKGICWGTTPSITTADSHTSDTISTNAISGNLTGLTSSTKYYARAYATNAIGTAYGDTVSFTTSLYIPTYEIAQVMTANSLGVGDSVGVNCKLIGVVNSINYTTTGYQFYILDDARGMFIYKTTTLTSYPTVTRGDSIRVIGKITMNPGNAYGMIGMAPDSIVKIAAGIALQSPLVINQLVDDSLESRLVKMNNLYYLSGWTTTGTATKTVLALHNSTDTITIRLTPTCNLFNTTAPSTTVPFSITGFVLQTAANATPYVGGYRIYPRDSFDITYTYSAPVVTTGTTTSITPNSAVCAGNVTSDGGHTITVRGVCYSLSVNPTIADSIRTATGTTGSFTANLSNLTLGTIYHYRAYATNSLGTTYGDDSTFTSSATAVAPVVVTGTASLITSVTASVSGTITNNGGASVTAKGICWGTTPNITIADSYFVDTTSTTTILGNLTGLASSTKFYAKAFATNSAGTSYGDTISFTTILNIPTYAIGQVKGVNTLGVADSLNVNCKLIGVVNSIDYTATGYQFYILDQTNGIEIYKTTTLTSYPTVTRGDSIRVIGKINQNSGNAYGMITIVPDSLVRISQNSALQAPIVITQLKNDSLESRLVKIDNLYYLSGWAGTGTRTVLASHGVDTITIRITTLCNIYNTAAPSTTVPFSITGFVLQSAPTTTTPYVGGYRIYPRDTNDISYNYTTPIVSTENATSITETTAVCYGNVTSDGGHAVTARGICYNTTANPTIADSVVTVTGTTGSYSANLSNLVINTTYHYRAYATNSLGTSYGGDSTFTTAANPVVPGVVTGTVSLITENSASVSGTITNNGGDPIIAKGICYGTNPNVTIADAFVSDTTLTSTAILSSLTGLNSSTLYYARAYATNTIGTGYGTAVSFTTLLHIPTYAIGEVKGIDALGQADSANVNCKLIGVVNSINYATAIGPGGGGYQFYILDQTNGMYIYKTTTLTSYPTIARGDSVRVIGKITQNPGNAYGMIGMIPDSIVRISQNQPLQSPMSISELTSDTLESRLVKMTNLYYVSGWTGGVGINPKTVLALHGSDTIRVILTQPCNLYNVTAPTNTVPFDITGFVLQNSVNTSAPYIGGYRIYPRDTNDYTVHYSDPAVFTTGVSGITQTTAMCSGNITTDGGYAITARGICYDTLVSPLATGNHVVVTGTTGTYTGNLTGLTLGTLYHYRAYATNSTGTYYGADSVFTTALTNVAPIVTTNNPATNIGYYSAAVTGNIVNNGGDTLLSKGICWSTNPVPTITDSVAYITGTTTTYTDTIKNLTDNTTYYARAFAINVDGVGYGNIITFTTKKLPPLYGISVVRTINVSGVADSLNVYCKLIGTVHGGINFSNNATTISSFFICDATSGINVYKTPNTLGYTITEGDMIRVIGKITQTNGLIQMVPDSLVLISPANPLNTPIVVTTLNDTYESRLIRMNNLRYLTGWPTTAANTASTVKTYNGVDTITVVIARYCNLQGTAAPLATDTLQVTGLESQNDATSPYSAGYFIYPRDTNDIVITHSTVGINEVAAKPSFSIYPNPTNGNFKVALSNNMDVVIRIYSMVGSMIEERIVNASSVDFNSSNYGRGMYMIQITDRKTGLSTTNKLVVQ